MIIGFTGKAGAGKDTAANLLKPYGFERVAFAGILKDMLAVAGLPEPAGRADKEKMLQGLSFTWRQAAQTLGTEWGRSLDPDIWVKLTMQKIASQPEHHWAFSDVRFENEAAAIRTAGGIVVHIIGREPVLHGSAAAHASEAGLISQAGDITLDNSGNLQNLATRLGQLLGISGVTDGN